VPNKCDNPSHVMKCQSTQNRNHILFQEYIFPKRYFKTIVNL